VLQNNSYKIAAEQIKQSFIEAGGTESAADLLEALSNKTSNVFIS
jgi:UDP:flavonoid glycosyltransferase YjiC (YdhE family)